jgi:hypothetical protein
MILCSRNVAEVETVDVEPDPGAEREEFSVTERRIFIKVPDPKGKKLRSAIPVFHSTTQIDFPQSGSITPGCEYRFVRSSDVPLVSRWTSNLENRVLLSSGCIHLQEFCNRDRDEDWLEADLPGSVDIRYFGPDV